MVSVEVLTVGKELLIGKTVNTNAYWVGGRLVKMGTMIRRVTVVTDSLDEISSSLNEVLARRPDFVIVVGGLGPTPDDMTLSGIARGLGVKLKVSRDAINMMKERYRKARGEEMVLTPARRKMARLPEGSTPLPNGRGTAPGVRIERDGSVIFCLPGVPREMKQLFRRTAEKEIRSKLGTLYSRTTILDLEKIVESTLTPVLRQAMRKNPEAYIKSHPRSRGGGVAKIELDVIVTSPNKSKTETDSGEVVALLENGVVSLGGTVVRKRIIDST